MWRTREESWSGSQAVRWFSLRLTEPRERYQKPLTLCTNLLPYSSSAVSSTSFAPTVCLWSLRFVSDIKQPCNLPAVPSVSTPESPHRWKTEAENISTFFSFPLCLNENYNQIGKKKNRMRAACLRRDHFFAWIQPTAKLFTCRLWPWITSHSTLSNFRFHQSPWCSLSILAYLDTCDATKRLIIFAREKLQKRIKVTPKWMIRFQEWDLSQV